MGSREQDQRDGTQRGGITEMRDHRPANGGAIRRDGITEIGLRGAGSQRQDQTGGIREIGSRRAGSERVMTQTGGITEMELVKAAPEARLG